MAEERREGILAAGWDGIPPDGTREILPGVLEFLDRSPSTHGGKGFLVTGPKYNLMVDTPAFTPRVLNAVRTVGGLRYLFLSHRDEIGEIADLHRATGGAIIMHRSEAGLVPCGVDLVFDTDFEVEPGVTVIHTPGHSPGSSCLLVHRGDLRVLFTGDHILRPGGQGVRRLLELEFDYMIPCRGDRPLLRESLQV